MSPAEVDRLLGLCDDAYPRQAMPDRSRRLFAALLADLPYPATRTALLAWIASQRFPPTVAELREAVFRALEDLPDAESAWGLVVEETHRQPRYDGGFAHYTVPTAWAGPLRAAVATLGFTHICLSDRPEITRAQFLESYRASVSRALDQWNRGRLADAAGELEEAAGWVAAPRAAAIEDE